MTASFILYAIVAAALITLAAVAIEPVFVARAWPRRSIWIMAMIASILLPALASAPSSSSKHERLAGVSRVAIPDGVHPQDDSNRTPRSDSFDAVFEWPALPSLDIELKYGWLALSMGLLSVYFAGWIRMRRSLRTWPTEAILGRTVFVSDDVGPAVVGFIDPEVVVPRWLLSASEGTRSSVIAHENEHIKARDPLCQLLALILLAVMPWNPILWWQLRRLRFAIEVDCDARVLRGNLDVLVYSETLLAVGQRGVRTLAGAITMVEPVTQLERRIEIMTAPTRRYSIAALCVAVGVSIACIAAATELRAPNPFDADAAQNKWMQRLASTNDVVNMRLKDADLRDVILLLEGIDGHKVYINSLVGGKVTIEFTDTLRKDALDTLLRTHNLVKRHDGDTIYIDPSPTTATAAKILYTGQRVNVHFANQNIRTILSMLAKVGNQNIVVAKDVDATVSVDFRDTPWDEALESVLKTNNLRGRHAGNLIVVDNAAQVR